MKRVSLTVTDQEYSLLKYFARSKGLRPTTLACVWFRCSLDYYCKRYGLGSVYLGLSFGKGKKGKISKIRRVSDEGDK